MKRLDDVVDPYMFDEKMRRYAWAGYSAVNNLCIHMAPQCTIPPAPEDRDVRLMFASQKFGPGGMPARAAAIPTESGYRLIDSWSGTFKQSSRESRRRGGDGE